MFENLSNAIVVHVSQGRIRYAKSLQRRWLGRQGGKPAHAMCPELKHGRVRESIRTRWKPRFFLRESRWERFAIVSGFRTQFRITHNLRAGRSCKPEFFQQVIESRAADSEGNGGRFFVPLFRCKRAEDMFPLDFGEGFLFSWLRTGAFVLESRREAGVIGNDDFIVGRHKETALDQIGQFADVSRPPVVH